MPVDFGTFWIFWIPERRGVAVFWLNWLTLEDSGKSGKNSKKKKYVSPISSWLRNILEILDSREWGCRRILVELVDSERFWKIWKNFTKKSTSRRSPVDFGTFWIPESGGVAVFWLNWLTLKNSGKSGKISKKKKYVSAYVSWLWNILGILDSGEWGCAVFWLNWSTLENSGKIGKISKKKKYVSAYVS